MNQTVIGVFDSRAEAQAAADALEARGCARSAIRITDEVDSTASTIEPSATARAALAEEPGLMHSLGEFFGRLFGDDESRVGHYAEAVRRGHCVVRVDVEDEAAAERATEALEGAGAVDIDERLAQWSTPAGAAAAAAAGASSLEFTSVSPGLYSPAVGDAPGGFDTPGAASGTSQPGAPAPSAATVADAADPSGDADGEASAIAAVRSPVRVYPGAPASPAEQDDDDRYRSDYASRYSALGGSYDDYAPAYRYGRTLAADPRHAGRDWTTVETEARSDWERDHAGDDERSGWDAVSEAVHSAWKDATGPA